MLYRDNNSNVRDTWAGISNDGGTSFTSGFEVDQSFWMLMSCPASGPDGFIKGDTLYSVYMNGASGTNRTFFGKSSISNPSAFFVPLTGSIAGLNSQNYPRIATDGMAAAIAWKQSVNSNDQLPLLFTSDIENGFSTAPDTLDLSNVTTVDVAMANGNIYVVWEDDGSGTIKYRKGIYSITTGTINPQPVGKFSIATNPVMDQLVILGERDLAFELTVQDVRGGEMIYEKRKGIHDAIMLDVSFLKPGIYFLKITEAGSQEVFRIVKL